jgi:NNP family nitrate/nitrite transporter-like MFS transporter
MIPVIFRALHLESARGSGPEAERQALAVARRETAAVVGFVAALGALGGYFIPRGFGASIRATGTVGVAMTCFVGFYLSCGVATWWCYLRRSFLTERLPSFAHARA